MDANDKAKFWSRLCHHVHPGVALLTGFLVLVLGARPASGDAFVGLVNLNTATMEELQHLPGVGPSKASKILEHRRHRPFRTVAELVRVKGFGAKTVSRLRPFLTVTAPTQLGAPAGAACVCPDADATGPANHPGKHEAPPTSLPPSSPPTKGATAPR